MSKEIMLFLVEDGVLTGAIYALLALASVLVFATTRVILVPQGEFVTFGALTLASFQLGMTPGIVYLLGLMAALATVLEIAGQIRLGQLRKIPVVLLIYAVIPATIIGVAVYLAQSKISAAIQILLTVALVTPLGPLLYRLAFQPIADSSTRLLFVVAIAAHFVLQGAGLLFFGAEGFRVTPLLEQGVTMGGFEMKGQAILVLVTAFAFTGLLYMVFEYTMLGKALRATAVNRLGARIVGISSPMVGAISFGIAALMGAVSGILAAGLTTIYYDSGFIIGLKAFVGAICGNMVSYPLAIAGALAVGVIESFGAFWASAYKDAIVFGMLVPVLVWLSLHSTAHEEEEDA